MGTIPKEIVVEGAKLLKQGKFIRVLAVKMGGKDGIMFLLWASGQHGWATD